MDASLIDTLIRIIVPMMICWNAYLFKSVLNTRTELMNYKLEIANRHMAKQDVEKMITSIAERLEGMETRIEDRLTFLLQNQRQDKT